MLLAIKPAEYLALGLQIAHGRPGDRCFRTELRHYRACYGVSPTTTAITWSKIQANKLTPRARPRHLLWALFLLTVYAKEEVCANFFGVHEDTFREWAFELIKAIAMLKTDYVSCSATAINNLQMAC